ncbi:hypothetical protein [Alkalihalobacillus sp. 1P02AB]|uniref:hypothetical protein n=1 Tax=Alkalihalobacillus sp. 1P02AB TaxID=3132260 RepID=UPI0039A75DB1
MKMNNDDVLLGLVTRQQRFINYLNESSEKDGLYLEIISGFILKNEHLHNDYVDYLKSLKTEPYYEGCEREIETLLTEYGSTKEHLNNHLKLMNTMESNLTNIEYSVLNRALADNDKIELEIFNNLINNEREVSGIEIQEFVKKHFPDEYDKAAREELGDMMSYINEEAEVGGVQ